ILYTQPVAQQPQQASGMNKAGLAALISGIVLVGVAGFLFAKSSGVLNAQKPMSPTGAVINAPNTQTAPAPILSAPQPQMPKAPILKPPGTVGNPMPADVIAYLRWLKWFEGERHRLESKNEGEVMPMLMTVIKDLMAGESLGLLDGTFESGEKPTKPAPNYSEDINKVIGEWNQASSVFKQKMPPDPCAPLATSYSQSIDASVQSMSSILSGFSATLQKMKDSNGDTNVATGALKNLMGEKNSKSSSHNIDALYRGANAALDAVRNRYTDIPLDISGSNFQIVSEGSSLSIPGLGM
uniref:hypothetical protein n=1 Tax=Armatimonas sp. TaxID=1872638 RepID=UPI003750C1AB